MSRDEHPGPANATTTTNNKKKKPKTYNFHREWEGEFLFANVAGASVCLICRRSVALSKRGNLERHHRTVHPSFRDRFPPESAARAEKLAELKGLLTSRHAPASSSPPKAANGAKAATEASFRIAHLLVKRKRPFTDGEVIKEAMAMAADALFRDFPNGEAIAAAVRAVPLGASTVARRVGSLSEDDSRRALRGLSSCECFSLQLAEAATEGGAARLLVLARAAFADSSTTEDLLALLPLDAGADDAAYAALRGYAAAEDLPLGKLAAIAGAGAGLVALCRADPRFPRFVAYDCAVRPPAAVPGGSGADFPRVTAAVDRMSDAIRAAALSPCHRRNRNRGPLRPLLDELDPARGREPSGPADTWPKRARLLELFVELAPDIADFLRPGREPCGELRDGAWLLDLAFAADLAAKLGDLGREPRAGPRDLSRAIGAANAFRLDLGLWRSQLGASVTANFPNLQKTLLLRSVAGESFRPERFCGRLDALRAELAARFHEVTEMEPVVAFLSDPFRGPVDAAELAAAFREAFQVCGEEIEAELTAVRNDVELSARWRDGESFWGLADRHKYPLLRSCALKVKACFGDTRLRDAVLEQMGIARSKYRAHLADCVRVAVSNREPDFGALADAVQSQASH